MKILLLGRDGQVGWELQRSLSALGEVVALCRDAAKNPVWEGQTLCGDLTDLPGLADTVRRVQPQVIVNAAAHTAVDKAESEAALAHTINTFAPEVLALESARMGAWLLHYSTDYVFDGSGDQPWGERDATGPLSVYGRTKLEGEQRIAAANPRHVILRTSWVYGARGGNFAKTMLRLAAERERLNVINDQHGAPTSAELLADVTAHVIRATQQDAALAGVYHCAAAGETTWHGYAQYVLAQAQALGWSLKAGPEQVGSTSTANYPTPAQRPLNSRLNTHKLEAAFGLRLPAWQQGVARMLTEITGKN